MLDSIFVSGSITLVEVALCTGVALLLGFIIAFVYKYKNQYSKGFVFTLALLPVLVQSIIMVVNGNLGAGVATMGAFSLVRFRSAPGNAREIVTIFFAMAVGLACGMGYLTYAVIFTLIISIIMLIMSSMGFGNVKGNVKSLRVTLPEDMDYTHLFDDLFEKYTTDAELIRVRTTSLGSLFELQYQITIKNVDDEKELIDGIRQRNGNLTVTCGMPVVARDEL